MSARVIVCGGREYNDRETMARVLYEALNVRATDRTVVVHGAARGADRLAASIAENWGLRTEPHPAKWKRPDGSLDKGAGFARNEEMAALGADLCIAFPGGNGTADMVGRAKAHGIPVRMVDADGRVPSPLDGGSGRSCALESRLSPKVLS